VKATQQRQCLGQRLARLQPPRARESGAKKLSGGRIVSDIVAASTANQLGPRELLVAVRGELGGTRGRLLRSLVVRAKELDPADLPPPRGRDVVPAYLLRECRPFVQRRRAFLVRAASRVDERAA
jgi:hypothetical protein